MKGLAKWWRGEHIKPASHVDFFGRVIIPILWTLALGGWIALFAYTGNIMYLIYTVVYFAIVFFYLRGLRFRMLAVNTYYHKELDAYDKRGQADLRRYQSEAAGILNAQLAEIGSKNATIVALQRELESRPPAQIM